MPLLLIRATATTLAIVAIVAGVEQKLQMIVEAHIVVIASTPVRLVLLLLLITATATATTIVSIVVVHIVVNAIVLQLLYY